MSGPGAVPSAAAEWKARIAANWWLKLFGITAFITVFFFAYFALLRCPLFPVTVVPLTWLDRWVPFQPAALGLYLSLWFYVSLPPSLLRTRPALFAYGWIAGGVAVTGLAIFPFRPTAMPVSTGIEWIRYPGFTWLKSVDAAQNACPSLHVAFAVFSGVWLDRILRVMPVGRFGRGLSVLWCLGIVYSTMATRQHVAVDVLAGTALGLLAAAIHPKALRQF